MSSPFHSFVCDPFISSSLLLCINSDSPVWLSWHSELCTWFYQDSKIAILSCYHACIPPFATLSAAWMFVYSQEGRGTGSFFSFLPIFPYFFSLLPNFFGRFSILPDFSPFSLTSLLRGLFYLLLHHSASFPHVFKEGKHTKHVCHVVMSCSFHTTFRFCHVSLKLWCLQHLF